METKSMSRLLMLHPSIRQDAIDAYNEAVRKTPVGVHPFITDTIRTFAKQDALYAQGRTKPGAIVTNSKAGQSYHNYGLALDFVIQIDGKLSWVVDKNWKIVVNCFKVRGFIWGGNFLKFKDYPHFEKRMGFNWKQLLAFYQQGKFIPGSLFVDLNIDK